MREIPLTQGKFAIVDDSDYEELMRWKWCYRSGYALRSEHVCMRDGKQIQKTILMHRVINKTPEALETDHINGNTLDNRKSNLRNATHAQNLRNQRQRNRNKSGFKGVSFEKRRSLWRAVISFEGKYMHIGYYETARAASDAYKKAAAEYFGEFAYGAY